MVSTSKSKNMVQISPAISLLWNQGFDTRFVCASGQETWFGWMVRFHVAIIQISASSGQVSWAILRNLSGLKPTMAALESIHNTSNLKETKFMQARVQSWQETINNRFKNWGILRQRYQHDIRRHGVAARSVMILTQISIDNGDKLFSCGYRDPPYGSFTNTAYDVDPNDTVRKMRNERTDTTDYGLSCVLPVLRTVFWFYQSNHCCTQYSSTA